MAGVAEVIVAAGDMTGALSPSPSVPLFIFLIRFSCVIFGSAVTTENVLRLAASVVVVEFVHLSSNLAFSSPGHLSR